MADLTRRGFFGVSAGMLLALSGCGGSQTSTDDGAQDQASSTDSVEAIYTYRFADAEEGKRLKMENVEYFDGLNQCDLDFRLQKNGGTLDEFKTLAASQLVDFTEEEKQALDWAMAELERRIAKQGIKPPASEEIIFIKSNMKDEDEASAYTHGTQIYLGKSFTARLLSEDQELRDEGVYILGHELFHCLTRSNPDFRASMYKIISFDVQDEDYVFGPDVAERIISNPDVEHHNSSALFTIGGEQKRCTVVFYAKKFFEKSGDNFFDYGGTGLVPVDDTNTLYDSEEASDFWEVFGKNTDYVIDPEEAMAENFGFLVGYGRDGKNYETPQIIDAILTELSE